MIGAFWQPQAHDHADLEVGVVHRGGQRRYGVVHRRAIAPSPSRRRWATFESVEPLYVLRMLAATQDGVVTAAQCRDAGLTPQQVKTLCRGRQWQPLNRGVYIVTMSAAGAEPPRRALIRAASISAGPRAVVALGTAAELHGIAGVRHEDVVHVTVPGVNARPRRSSEPGLRIHQLALGPDDAVMVEGIAVTSPARTVADLLLRVDRFTGVGLLDSALNRRILDPGDLDLVAALLVGRRGARRARPWLLEVDPRAESPLETRVRLRAVDGGIAPDELQYRVVDRLGEVVAIADLAWIGARVLGEADGAEAHDTPTALFRDRTRQNDIIAAGFAPVRFTWADTLTSSYIPAKIRAAIAGARAAA